VSPRIAGAHSDGPSRFLQQFAGYWQTTDFLKSIKEGKEEVPVKFYDSVTGKLLFTAPVGRTMEEFLVESQKHGTSLGNDVGVCRGSQFFFGRHVFTWFPRLTSYPCVVLLPQIGWPSFRDEEVNWYVRRYA
jgi:hypothetical protein